MGNLCGEDCCIVAGYLTEQQVVCADLQCAAQLDYGVHMWAGELALQLKSQLGYEDINLIVVLPFPEYDKQWDVKSRKRMEFLIENSAECLTLGNAPSQENYILVNCYLINHIEFLISVNEYNSMSAMLQMEKYAYKKGKQTILIHPDTAAISYRAGAEKDS